MEEMQVLMSDPHSQSSLVTAAVFPGGPPAHVSYGNQQLPISSRENDMVHERRLP